MPKKKVEKPPETPWTPSPKAEPKAPCAHETVTARRYKLPKGRVVVCPDCREELGPLSVIPPKEEGASASAPTKTSASDAEVPIALPDLHSSILADTDFRELAEEHRKLGDEMLALEKRRKEIGGELKSYLEESSLPGVVWSDLRAYMVKRTGSKFIDPDKLLKAGVPAQLIKSCETKKDDSYHVEVKRDKPKA